MTVNLGLGCRFIANRQLQLDVRSLGRFVTFFVQQHQRLDPALQQSGSHSQGTQSFGDSTQQRVDPSASHADQLVFKHMVAISNASPTTLAPCVDLVSRAHAAVARPVVSQLLTSNPANEALEPPFQESQCSIPLVPAWHGTRDLHNWRQVDIEREHKGECLVARSGQTGCIAFGKEANPWVSDQNASSRQQDVACKVSNALCDAHQRLESTRHVHNSSVGISDRVQVEEAGHRAEGHRISGASIADGPTNSSHSSRKCSHIQSEHKKQTNDLADVPEHTSTLGNPNRPHSTEAIHTGTRAPASKQPGLQGVGNILQTDIGSGHSDGQCAEPATSGVSSSKQEAEKSSKAPHPSALELVTHEASVHEHDASIEDATAEWMHANEDACTAVSAPSTDCIATRTARAMGPATQSCLKTVLATEGASAANARTSLEQHLINEMSAVCPHHESRANCAVKETADCRQQGSGELPKARPASDLGHQTMEQPIPIASESSGCDRNGEEGDESAQPLVMKPSRSSAESVQSKGSPDMSIQNDGAVSELQGAVVTIPNNHAARIEDSSQVNATMGGLSAALPHKQSASIVTLLGEAEQLSHELLNANDVTDASEYSASSGRHASTLASMSSHHVTQQGQVSLQESYAEHRSTGSSFSYTESLQSDHASQVEEDTA
jgi:hypothetical protein